MFDTFVNNYESLLYNAAVVATLTLEFIGVGIIVAGSLKALVQMALQIIRHRNINIAVKLGKTLALALEFKMGAEIIKTVIVRDLKELAVLGIVILIRALLAFLIHWEIKMERQHEEQTPSASSQ